MESENVCTPGGAGSRWGVGGGGGGGGQQDGVIDMRMIRSATETVCGVGGFLTGRHESRIGGDGR